MPRSNRLCCPGRGGDWLGRKSSTRIATFWMRLRNSSGSKSKASSATLTKSSRFILQLLSQARIRVMTTWPKNIPFRSETYHTTPHPLLRNPFSPYLALCLLVATRISFAFDRLDQTPVLNAFTISRSVKEVQARGVRNAVPSLVSSSGIPISPIRRNLYASSDDERNAQTH